MKIPTGAQHLERIIYACQEIQQKISHGACLFLDHDRDLELMVEEIEILNDDIDEPQMFPSDLEDR